MLNLDTHILIYALAGDLKPKEEALLCSHRWSISAIVIWELCKLRQLGRIDIDLKDVEVSRTLRRLHLWPLTFEICQQSCALDIKSDPADEIIAATSMVHNLPLITRDRTLRRSKIVPLAS